jgi:hypothetical protein
MLAVAYVALAIRICCKCFKRMLQVFYLDVAYLAVVIHICWKRMFVNVLFVTKNAFML